MTRPIDKATAEDLHVLHEQLGRVPRGVIGIGARCLCGRPTVVVTAPRLEDGTPFPTSFYLTCPPIVKGCSRLEAEHVMEEFNEWLAENDEARRSYQRAHYDYIERRRDLGGDVPEIDGVSAGGMPIRVKCLHALVGHALVAGRGVNIVGDRTLDVLAGRGLWDAKRCTC